MKVINIDLPVGTKEIVLLPLADLHIGEHACDMKLVKEQIHKIAENENYYTILNGDIIDNSIRTSIGDVYSQTMTPQEQLDLAVKLFTPIKDKILAITNGNHEERSYKDCGIDLMSCLAKSLGLQDRYGNEAAYIFLNFTFTETKKSKRIVTTIYATHGRGGGRKEGAKAIRLADMASIVDADIYIHSHTHLPMSMKQTYFKTNTACKSIVVAERLFVNTAATLDYAKYAEKNEYKPTSKSNPYITITTGYRAQVGRKSGLPFKDFKVTF